MRSLIVDNLFADSIQKGLGRAFEYLKKYQGDREFIRKHLLNACLHNLAYDPQCEASKANYLFELINLTGDSYFYREKILLSLPTSEYFWDTQQLYELALCWAKQGDREARELIYQTFRKQDDNESWLGGDRIIELDGINGLLAVAEIFGHKLLQDSELWEDDYLISKAQNLYGVEEVNSAIERAAVDNKAIKAYLDAVKAHELEIKSYRSQNPKNRYENIKLDDILQKIESPRGHWYLLNKFGINASDRDIEILFDRLLQETRKEQLRKYLWVFKNRQLPRIDNRLLDLARSEDDDIQFCAIRALANNKNDAIRSLAIDLIQNTQAIGNKLFSLFFANYQKGDAQILESALKQSPDLDYRHAAGMDLMKIIKLQKDPELINCSFWIYENTPCAHCRESILEILIESQQITTDILQECLLDSSEDIRTMAKTYGIER